MGKKRGPRFGIEQPVPKSPGRPRLTEEQKALRRLTLTEFQGIANKYLHMTREDAAKAWQNPAAEFIDLLVISALKDAVTKGDGAKVSWILERLIGKVPSPVEMTLRDEIDDDPDVEDSDLDEWAK